MSKAIRAVVRPRHSRKARAPFTLDAEARKLLKAHQMQQAAERSFRVAAASEKAAGRNPDDYSPATVQLRDRWHASMKEVTAMGDAVAARIARKQKPTPADCLTLAIASWHSVQALRHCTLAVLGSAGIDMLESSER